MFRLNRCGYTVGKVDEELRRVVNDSLSELLEVISGESAACTAGRSSVETQQAAVLQLSASSEQEQQRSISERASQQDAERDATGRAGGGWWPRRVVSHLDPCDTLADLDVFLVVELEEALDERLALVEA